VSSAKPSRGITGKSGSHRHRISRATLIRGPRLWAWSGRHDELERSVSALCALPPYRQVSYTYASMIVRSTMNPESLGPAVRSAVSAVDPDQPLYDVRSMSQVIRESTISITYVSVMMMALGVLALILAGSGVYGVLAFTVTQSTHENRASDGFGSATGDVLRLIVDAVCCWRGLGCWPGFPWVLAVAFLGAGYISNQHAVR